MNFASLGLTPHLIRTLLAQKYSKPYPIQEKAIPAILDNKDVLGIAPTGSGKTASYVLPLLINLDKKLLENNKRLYVLVLVPTRELAIQVEEVFKTFSSRLPYNVRSLALYGGLSIDNQRISNFNTNALVATPGKLIELVNKNVIQLSSVSSLILDEADKLLNPKFEEEMEQILALLPEKRQNLLFSATLNPAIKNTNKILLQDPVVIRVESELEKIDSIDQIAYFVPQEQKGPLLRYLINQNSGKQILIFTASTYQADLITKKLLKRGIKARAIHSKKSQSNRINSLNSFKRGEINILVATDLLSRGIDIEFLPFVINYELPRSPKDFIHRIGRTGRAENIGQAISFVTKEDEHHFKVIQKKIKKQIPIIESNTIDLKGF